MSLTQVFVSCRGRINREIYWLSSIGMLAVFAALVSVELANGGVIGKPGLVLVLACYVPLFWGMIAVSVKRLHDRGKSARWLILFFLLPIFLDLIVAQTAETAGMILLLINLAISGWAFVELGLLPGTRGANDYGPDPLQPHSDTPA